jgi:hypothetical protein
MERVREARSNAGNSIRERVQATRDALAREGLQAAPGEMEAILDRTRPGPQSATLESPAQSASGELSRSRTIPLQLVDSGPWFFTEEYAAQLQAAGYRISCFTAGTPLLTPAGAKNIEEFEVGDLVLSRSEFEQFGRLEAKAVEETFVRNGRIWNVHVEEQTIRTTGEHPFYVCGKGWTPAAALRKGDWLFGSDGRQTRVKDAYDTASYERVYNLRIADYHTYFVGDTGWGFSVWAHNESCSGAAGDNGKKLLEEGFQEVDPTVKTDMLRNRPGVAHGGEELPGLTPGTTWLDKATGSVGLIPQEVAAQLRGRSFTDWRNFRREFWKAVGNVPELLAQFKPANQANILAGKPPIAPKSGHVGNRRAFELDHMDPLSITGPRGVYDLDNIMVAPPKVNLSFELF